MSKRNISEEIMQGMSEAIVYVRDQSSDFLDSYLEGNEIHVMEKERTCDLD